MVQELKVFLCFRVHSTIELSLLPFLPFFCLSCCLLFIIYIHVHTVQCMKLLLFIFIIFFQILNIKIIHVYRSTCVYITTCTCICIYQPSLPMSFFHISLSSMPSHIVYQAIFSNNSAILSPIDCKEEAYS